MLLQECAIGHHAGRAQGNAVVARDDMDVQMKHDLAARRARRIARSVMPSALKAFFAAMATRWTVWTSGASRPGEASRMLRAGCFGMTERVAVRAGHDVHENEGVRVLPDEIAGHFLAQDFRENVASDRMLACPWASPPAVSLSPFGPTPARRSSGAAAAAVEKVSFSALGGRQKAGSPPGGGTAKYCMTYYRRLCQSLTWRSASSSVIP